MYRRIPWVIAPLYLGALAVALGQTDAPPTPAQGRASGPRLALVSSISYQSRTSNFWNALSVVARTMPGGGGIRGIVVGPSVGTDAMAAELEPQATTIFKRQDLLVNAMAEVLDLKPEQIAFVPPAKWGQWSKTATENQHRVSVSPGTNTSTVRGGVGFVNSTGVAFTLNFDPPVTTAQAREIINSYKQQLAPEMRRISLQLFTQKFEAAMETARRAQDGSEARIHDLENRRRVAQARMLEELPAEYLTDLRRMQLNLKLSQVGLNAREAALRDQMERIDALRKEQNDRSPEPAAPNERMELLRQLIKLRSDQLEILQQGSREGDAKIRQDEIKEANSKLLGAKLQLKALEVDLKLPADLEQRATLRSQLDQIAVDRKDTEARIQYVETACEQTLGHIMRKGDLEHEIKQIDELLPQEKVRLQAAQQRIDELTETKNLFAPIDLSRNDGL